MEGVHAQVWETDDPEVVVTQITHHGQSNVTGAPYQFTALGVIRVRGGEIVHYMDPIALARLLPLRRGGQQRARVRHDDRVVVHPDQELPGQPGHGQRRREDLNNPLRHLPVDGEIVLGPDVVALDPLPAGN
jgi:hypothetical protein